MCIYIYYIINSIIRYYMIYIYNINMNINININILIRFP